MESVGGSHGDCKREPVMMTCVTEAGGTRQGTLSFLCSEIKGNSVYRGLGCNVSSLLAMGLASWTL